MMPAVTKDLITINVLVFLGTVVAQRYGLDLTNYLGLHFFLTDDFNPAQSITYMFMHGGFSHISFNIFAAFVFGPILEQTWGPKRSLFYYILCGIGVGLIQEGVQYIRCVTELSQRTHISLMGYSVVPTEEYLSIMTTVGVSEAVYAILLASGTLFPSDRLFIFPLLLPIKTKFFVIGYAVIELWSGLTNSTEDNITHFARLGGMLFGPILILYWRKKSNNSETYYS